jgi:hypothetical protein
VGVGSRSFTTFLCDACGREIISEEGLNVDGYYIDVQQIRDGQQSGNENIFACSDVCLPRAIRDGLFRQTLPEQQKISATQELWMRGRKFNTDPRLPIYDAKDESRVIGTAREIAENQPSARPELTALDDDWRYREAP